MLFSMPTLKQKQLRYVMYVLCSINHVHAYKTLIFALSTFSITYLIVIDYN